MLVVSHRGPATFTPLEDGSFTASRGAGGVVSGLAPLLAGTGATWVAAAMSDDDRAAVRAGAARLPEFDLALLDLDPDLHRLHYETVSNATLWPLLHGLFDLVRRPHFDRRFRGAWDAYVAVNEAFASAAAVAGEGDTVVVHDYQLALVPGMLRRVRPDLRMVHFTHTPFCGPEGIRVLPEPVARQLCASMASVPAGFHTRRWVRNYHAAAAEALGPEASLATPFAAPLGPDPDDLSATASSPEAQQAAAALAERTGDRAVLLRVDRLEPSKNIVRSFAAYDQLLEIRPRWRERVVFVALVYPSRQDLPEYVAYRGEVEEAAERVNERWAGGDWCPILLDTRDDYPTSVAAMGAYDVLIVNPIRDGLNLVSKEGPLLNRRHGVLCLSRGAGSWDELGEAAVEVHPFDVLQTAEALDVALAMPAEERAARAARLRARAASRTPALWLEDLLAHAG